MEANPGLSPRRLIRTWTAAATANAALWTYYNVDVLYFATQVLNAPLCYGGIYPDILLHGFADLGREREISVSAKRYA